MQTRSPAGIHASELVSKVSIEVVCRTSGCSERKSCNLAHIDSGRGLAWLGPSLDGDLSENEHGACEVRTHRTSPDAAQGSNARRCSLWTLPLGMRPWRFFSAVGPVLSDGGRRSCSAAGDEATSTHAVQQTRAAPQARACWASLIRFRLSCPDQILLGLPWESLALSSTAQDARNYSG